MVSIHDTVPHTVNTIEAGNPGAPIEVALEAGKTILSRCRKDPGVADKYINGGTHTTGQRFNFRAAPLHS
jgi:hypothetical protein